MTQLETQGLAARNAARVLSVAGTARKNQALEAIARAFWPAQEEILSANAADLEAGKAAGLRTPPCWTGWLWTQGASPASWKGCGRVAALPTPSVR